MNLSARGSKGERGRGSCWGASLISPFSATTAGRPATTLVRRVMCRARDDDEDERHAPRHLSLVADPVRRGAAQFGQQQN